MQTNTIPTGKLKLFVSDDLPLYVNVHRIGKRRKYIDKNGGVFIRVNGKIWKFPEQVSY